MVEVLVFLVIALVMIGGVYQLMIGQTRLWQKQSALEDVRSSLRAAATLLSFELRQASPAYGDIYFIEPDSFAVRSPQGSGIICGKHGTQPRLGLRWTWGDFFATSDDSAMVFVSGNLWLAGSMDEAWLGGDGATLCAWGTGSVAPDVVAAVSVQGRPPDKADGDLLITPRGDVLPGGTFQFTVSHADLSCSDFDGRAQVKIDGKGNLYNGTLSGCTFTIDIPGDVDELKIDVTLKKDDYAELDEDVTAKYEWKNIRENTRGAFIDGIRVGAPFRAYRRSQYGIFQQGGRWWLGRRVGAGDYEVLTGPLRPPSDSGLVFRYYDQAGNPTASASRVRTVEILLRAESLKVARRGGSQDPAVQQDSIRVFTAIRG